MVAALRGNDQTADSDTRGVPLTRLELHKDFDRFRDEMHCELRHDETKPDVANLKTWMVGPLLVVVLNVLERLGRSWLRLWLAASQRNVPAHGEDGSDGWVAAGLGMSARGAEEVLGLFGAIVD